jgi:acyl carrier protein
MKLTESDIKAKLHTFIKEYFVKDSKIVVKDHTSLLDESVLDSTGVIELVAYIETTFGINVKDEDIIPENFDSVNKLLNYVLVSLKDH